MRFNIVAFYQRDHVFQEQVGISRSPESLPKIRTEFVICVELFFIMEAFQTLVPTYLLEEAWTNYAQRMVPYYFLKDAYHRFIIILFLLFMFSLAF